ARGRDLHVAQHDLAVVVRLSPLLPRSYLGEELDLRHRLSLEVEQPDADRRDRPLARRAVEQPLVEAAGERVLLVLELPARVGQPRAAPLLAIGPEPLPAGGDALVHARTRPSVRADTAPLAK